MTVLIVGAAGNLGSLLATHLRSQHALRLMVHNTQLPGDLARDSRIVTVKADLNDPASLVSACTGVDCIVYLAGVLFRPNASSFLPITNTKYVEHLVDAALACGVRRFILVSFPHVEGETTPQAPARGRPDARPSSIHARTRLAAEQYLSAACDRREMTPLILRAGVIYGRGVKLMDAARTLMGWRLLAIWPAPTWVHLVALPDFLRVVEIGIVRDDLSGIFNVCDDQPMLLQEFLDAIAAHWGCRRPLRLPALSFYGAAIFCEAFARLFGTSAPLTRDLVEMGMTSVVADTSRMKREIAGPLLYPTLKQGLPLL